MEKDHSIYEQRTTRGKYLSHKKNIFIVFPQYFGFNQSQLSALNDYRS